MAPTRGRLWSRFATVTRPFFQSEQRWPAVALLGLLLGFILCLVGLHALGSYMNRNFTNAVTDRQTHPAAVFAALWAGVFGMLTVAGVLKAFAEDRLRLRWRRWLTRYLMDRYLAHRAYYQLRARADVDNPDQRIAEDVKTF